MNIRFVGGVIALLGLVAAGGCAHKPEVATCELQLVEASMMDLSPMSTKWDLLGQIAIADDGEGGDILKKEKNRAKIRPRACAMGGEAIAVMLAATGQGAFGQKGGTVIVAVLRKKIDRAPAPPEKF